MRSYHPEMLITQGRTDGRTHGRTKCISISPRREITSEHNIRPKVSVTHTHTHTHHSIHTCGSTHPRCLTHTGGYAHACRFWRTRGPFRLRCPFHTRRAGKHALRHTRKHTTHTRGLFHTRGRTHTRGSSQTTPVPRAMRALQHAFRHARVHTHVDTTHTGTTLVTTHTGTLTPGILATSRAPGVSILPKLRVHPFAALFPSPSPGTTEPTWS